MMSVAPTISAHELPLRVNQDGVILVGGSRVTLDTLIHWYREGASAEEIALAYDSLALADVYAALSYYLNNRNAVDAYLVQRRGRAEVVRRQIDSRMPMREVRARLEARMRVT